LNEKNPAKVIILFLFLVEKIFGRTNIIPRRINLFAAWTNYGIMAMPGWLSYCSRLLFVIKEAGAPPRT
jgi:hypothetical protein